MAGSRSSSTHVRVAHQPMHQLMFACMLLLLLPLMSLSCCPGVAAVPVNRGGSSSSSCAVGSAAFMIATPCFPDRCWWRYSSL